jgi:hypothetical protein
MASSEAELRAWEQRLRAREGELTARRARWGAAWRAALAPARTLELLLGVWLALGATVLGGSVLVASAVACGLLVAFRAVRAMSMPAAVAAPRPGGVGVRLRARLGRRRRREAARLR